MVISTVGYLASTISANLTYQRIGIIPGLYAMVGAAAALSGVTVRYRFN